MSKSPSLVPVRHGAFVISVPLGWADESTMSFMAPKADALAAPLSPKPALSYSSNVHVTLEQRPEGDLDASAFLDIMREGLLEAGAFVEDVRPPASFKMAGREGAMVERRATLNNQAVRQIVAAVFLEHNIIVASAATSEAEIEREQE